MANKCSKVLVPAFFMVLTCCSWAFSGRGSECLWAEETLSGLSRDQKIGQLFVVGMTPYGTSLFVGMPGGYGDHTKQIQDFLREYPVGGVMIGGGVCPQSDSAFTARLFRLFQAASPVPALTTIDAEWGLKMRIADGMQFPYAMTLGAITDLSLVYECGREIGRQCKLLGATMNFAPVVDLATNPYNPIIGIRAFGDSPDQVVAHARAFADGLRDAGVLACIKHFPGHGPTAVDSHVAMPTITASHEVIREHLEPFARLIKSGIPAVMVGHLSVPALELKSYTKSYLRSPAGQSGEFVGPQAPLPLLGRIVCAQNPRQVVFDESSYAPPASCSPAIVTGLLREEFGFDGLAITDALKMGGVTEQYAAGMAAVQALRAGNDILLVPDNLPVAFNAIRKALDDGELSIDVLDAHVRRVLQVKQRLLGKRAPRESLCADMHTLEAYALRTKLYQAAITLVHDTHKILPLAGGCQVTHVQIGQCATPINVHEGLVCIEPGAQKAAWKGLYESLKPFDIVMLHITALTDNPGRFGEQQQATPALARFLKRVAKSHTCVTILYSSPFALAGLPPLDPLLVAYEHVPDAWDAAWRVVTGLLPACGQLPVSVALSCED